jgi:DNA-binding transcriptional LysR family regulator
LQITFRLQLMLSSDDLAFFAVLAGSRSLADGARKLNVTPPAVSQRLRALEERAGVRLIDRSGSRLSLTEEGSLVVAHAAIVGEALETLAEALADRRGAVTGHLRVAAPHGFGRRHVAPVVDAFAQLHRAATVTLELSDHPASLLIDSYDVVIHIGEAGRGDQLVTTLAPNRRILCASPAYLDSAPSVSVPADLAAHRCLVIRENDEDVTLWRFRRGGGEAATVRVHPAMASNDGSVIRQWALAGQGIVVRSEWDVAGDLSEGRLKPILTDWQLPAADVLAMLGPRHGRSARTNAFLALLRKSLAPPPWRRAIGQPEQNEGDH